MDDGELDPRDERRTWIWVVVGCGGFALSALCLATPVAWLLVHGGEDSSDEPPAPAPQPLPSPTPAPPMVPVPSLPQPPVSPSPPMPPPPRAGTAAPRHVTAVVEEADGLRSVHPGAECSFDVERIDRPDRTFLCVAQIRCAGELLYGGANAGYFECTLYEHPERHVVGQDAQTTAADGDAAMRLDTLRGVLTVQDDAAGRHGPFSVRARVTGVR